MLDQPSRNEGRRGRIAKACTQCRIAKTRCAFTEGCRVCDKCLQRGLECTMLPQGALAKAPAIPVPRAPGPQGSGPRSDQTSDALSPRSNSSSTSKGAASFEESPSSKSHHSGINGSTGSYSMGGGSTGSGPGARPQHAPDSSDGSKNLSAIKDAFSPTSLHYQASNSSGSAENMHFESPLLGAEGFPELTAFASHETGLTPLPDMAITERRFSGSVALPRSGALSMGPLSSSSLSASLPGPLSGPLSRPLPEGGLEQSLHHHSDNSLSQMDSVDQPVESVDNLDALEGGFPSGDSPMPVDPTGEYFMNLGVFPESLGDPVQSQPPARSLSRFRFHNSASAMVFQAIDPVLHDQLGAMSRLLLPPRRISTRNVVNQRILSYRQVVRLFGFFKSNYNHWISLPDAEPEELANFLLEQCPLLVTTCCCIALRLGSSELWQTTYPSLVRYLTYELAQTLVSLPQTIECLQALTILAKYADALSYGDFVFDMWYISGIGIQHLQTVASINNQFSYIHMRLWNHLVLAHVSSANISGRAVVVGDNEIQMCRLVLSESLATRFDRCMVAELMVQGLTIQFLRQRISYAEFEKGVAEWQQEWGMLAQLPMIQFVEPVLLFCCFLVRWTHHCRFLADSNSPPMSPLGDEFSYGAASNMAIETLYDELQNICVILNALLNMVQVEYFGCLSDALHGMGFISAIMAMVITKVLVDKGEVTQTEQKQQLSACAQLISQLAHRFQVTSRGQDIFRTRCVALTQLLKSNPFF